MKRSGISILCVTLAVFNLAASGEQSKAGTSPKTSAAGTAAKKSISNPTPTSLVSNTIVDLFKKKEGKGSGSGQSKTGKELMAAKGAQPPAPSSTKPAAPVRTSGAPSAPKKIPAAVSSKYVPPPPAKAPSPQVSQIRNEVQKILDLNKRIKNLQGDRVSQMQRIQEQARIHQKILDQLESGTRSTKAVKSPGKEALLAQEKLRIISEETKKNQQVLAEIKKEPKVREDQASKKT